MDIYENKVDINKMLSVQNMFDADLRGITEFSGVYKLWEQFFHVIIMDLTNTDFRCRKRRRDAREYLETNDFDYVCNLVGVSPELTKIHIKKMYCPKVKLYDPMF